MRDFFHRRGGSVLAVAGGLLFGAACGQAPASQSSSPREAAETSPAGDDAVVARVGGREIRLAEVDDKALQTNMRAYQELYNARRQALEEMVADALLEQEAAKRGVSVEELVAEEITSKMTSVTPQDVEAFFNQNQSRLGGRTLEQIRPQIQQYLESQRETAARQGFLARLESDAAVAIDLDPPRVPVQVASTEPIKGPADAPVTIVEYSDFQ